jgi:hypothetical protein
MKRPRVATITFTAPPPDFCGGGGVTTAVGVVPVGVFKLAPEGPTAPPAAACTAMPHLAQNFVPSANGLPHPTQNFFSGSAVATHFAPHEEQNTCASPSDALQALHLFAISEPPSCGAAYNHSPPHFFVTAPS